MSLIAAVGAATAVEGSDDNGRVNLGDVGRWILAAVPDVDPRSCG